MRRVLTEDRTQTHPIPTMLIFPKKKSLKKSRISKPFLISVIRAKCLDRKDTVANRMRNPHLSTFVISFCLDYNQLYTN